MAELFPPARQGAWHLGKICMKTKTARQAPRFGVIHRWVGSPAAIYQPLAGPPGGRQQLALIAEAIPERDRKAVVEVRTPNDASVGTPSEGIGTQIFSTQVCSPAWRDGGKGQSHRGSRRQRAFAKHGLFSIAGCYETVVNPGIYSSLRAGRALAVSAGRRYKRGQLHVALI
jgi:hypothetical protein